MPPVPEIKFVDAANDVRYAFRSFGSNPGGVPLVMHIHFRANMFYWDPALIAALAASRRVIVFDNSGVGSSTGEVPNTYQGWADSMIAFMQAIGDHKVDLLGFSMGGWTAQMVALTAPHLVRRLILAGTGPSQPSENPGGIIWPRETAPADPIRVLDSASSIDEMENAIAYSFFYDDDEGRAEAKKYWARIKEQPHPGGIAIPLQPLDAAKTKLQRDAGGHWRKPNPRNSFDRLHELKMPTLIINGDKDVLIPTSHSWELHAGISNSQLIIYPKSGHGFIWQYAGLVASHISSFLDRDDFTGAARL